MPGFLPASLRGQILCCLLIPLILLLIGNAYFVYDNAKAIAEQTYDSSLQAAALVLAGDISEENGRVTIRHRTHFPDGDKNSTGEQRYFRVSGPQGEYVAGLRDLPRIVPGAAPISGTPIRIELADIEYQGRPLRLAVLEFPLAGRNRGNFVKIELAETLVARTNLSRQILWDTLMHQSLLIAAAGLLVWCSVAYVLRPLQSLSRQLLQRSAGDLSNFPVQLVQTEIQPLILAINAYMGRLLQMINSRQRFIADASHQLRTPLTVLKTQTDLALREQNIDAMHELIAHISRTTDSTVELANHLLNLSRAGHVIAQQDMQEVDLREILRSLAIAHSVSAIRKKIDLSLDISNTGDFGMRGHPLLLREMLNNLIDNALRYTPDGGQVRLSARATEHKLQIDIADSGPGIPADEHAMVFSPFYRNHNGLETYPEGSGLGLSIVNDIVLAHGGQISLNDACLTPSSAGLLLRIVLPRYTSQQHRRSDRHMASASQMQAKVNPES